MRVLGKINIKKYLDDKAGVVTGQVVTDGKYRFYRNEYVYRDLEDGKIAIALASGSGDTLVMPGEVD